MSGLKLTDAELVKRLTMLLAKLPHDKWLNVKIRHDGTHKFIRWTETPIDKQPVKSED